MERRSSKSVLYYALSECLPYAGEDFATLAEEIIKDKPRPLSVLIDIDPELERLVMKMLSKSPADRPDARLVSLILRRLAEEPDQD